MAPFLTDPTGSPPVVGISGGTTNSKSVIAMAAQVRACGAIPMVFANHGNRDPHADINKIDTLIVMGSDYDISPSRYIHTYPEGDPRRAVHPKTVSETNDPNAKARAAYEETILKLAMERKMPTLGVCAGMQAINVIRGGGMLQHIPDLLGHEHHEQNKDGIAPFSPVTAVEIDKNSSLGLIAGSSGMLYTPGTPPANMVGVYENSFHHQAIDPDRIGYGLRVTAFSDGYTNVNGEERRLPEAIEPDPNGPLAGWPMRAVQWHPEFGASPVSANLIAATIEEGAQYALTSPRDRSRDTINALAANIVSAGKNNQLSAEKSESFAASVYENRQMPSSISLA